MKVQQVFTFYWFTFIMHARANKSNKKEGVICFANAPLPPSPPYADLICQNFYGRNGGIPLFLAARRRRQTKLVPNMFISPLYSFFRFFFCVYSLFCLFLHLFFNFYSFLSSFPFNSSVYSFFFTVSSFLLLQPSSLVPRRQWPFGLALRLFSYLSIKSYKVVVIITNGVDLR